MIALPAAVRNAWLQWRAAPLSRRAVLRLAVAVDDAIDAGFTAAPEEDVSGHRARLAGEHAALAQVMDLACGAAALRLGAIAVPLNGYGALDVADVMVSVYNGHTIPRVLMVTEQAQTEVGLIFAQAFAALGWQMPATVA